MNRILVKGHSEVRLVRCLLGYRPSGKVPSFVSRLFSGAGCSFSEDLTRSCDDLSLAGRLVLLLVSRTPWFIMFLILILEYG